MLPAIERRSGRSRYASATLSSSSTATRCSLTSTEITSSRFAAGSGARRGGVRRRVVLLRCLRWDGRRSGRDSSFFAAGLAAGFASVGAAFASGAAPVAGRFRPRPPPPPGRRALPPGRRAGCRTLPAAPATATAAALLLGGIGWRARLGGPRAYGVGRCRGWRWLGAAALVSRRLGPPEPSKQVDSPCRARALPWPGVGRSARCNVVKLVGIAVTAG